MGFISRLVGRKQEKRIIEFGELDSILTEQLEKLKNMSFFESWVKEVFKAKESLEKDIDSLKNADISGIEPTIASSASSAREQLVSKLQNIISSISVPDSFEKLNDTAETAFHFLKASQETGQRVTDYLTFAFEKQMKKLSDSLKSFEKPVLQITSELKNRNFKIAEIKSCFDMLRSYSSVLGEKELIDKEISHISSKIDENKKLSAEKKRQIEYVKESPSYSEFVNKKKEIEAINEKKKEIVNSFANDVSSLEKPFRKYVNTLDKNHPYSKFIEKFLETYLENLSISNFVSILEQVRKMVNSGEMELKGRQKEKAIKTIDSLSLSYLNDVMAGYNELEQRRVVAEGFILSSDIEKDISRIEAEIANLESDVKSEETELAAKKIELDIRNKMLLEKKEKIKELLDKNTEFTF